MPQLPALVIIATILPILTYMVMGLRRSSRAKTVDDYFIYSQRVSPRDYANTFVGYALQMGAVFLFAYWAILYGLGALWTVLFWGLGFLLLYFLLPRFLLFHKTPMTMHQYLATRYGAGRKLQTLAASATILGLWGTMMAEIDYTSQIYAPVLPTERYQLLLGAGFLIFGTLYIIANGYKAEVNTERYSVPAAYVCFIAVIIASLPSVWAHGGPRPYCWISALLILTLLTILGGMLQISWRRPIQEPQVIIPLAALAAWVFMNHYVHSANGTGLPPGSYATVLSNPIPMQLKAQGYLGLFSLFIANAFWMPVDLSTWQKIASVEGQQDADLLTHLRRGTARVLLQSPASWCLGVALGLIINAGGFLPPNHDASEGIPAFAGALARHTLPVNLGWAGNLLYPVFIVASVSIMLSTVDSIISTIAYTAFNDMPPYLKSARLLPARVWTVGIIIAGLCFYPFLRLTLGTNLPTVLYCAYSAQLSLLVVVSLVLTSRKLLRSRGALLSIIGGFAGTAFAGYLAVRTQSTVVAVLPPIFAVVGALLGYFLAYTTGDSRRDIA